MGSSCPGGSPPGFAQVLPGPGGHWIWNPQFIRKVMNSQYLLSSSLSWRSKCVLTLKKQFPFIKVRAAGSHKNYSLSLWKPSVSRFKHFILLRYASVLPGWAHSWLISCEAHFKCWRGLQKWPSDFPVVQLAGDWNWTSPEPKGLDRINGKLGRQ